MTTEHDVRAALSWEADRSPAADPAGLIRHATIGPPPRTHRPSRLVTASVAVLAIVVGAAVVRSSHPGDHTGHALKPTATALTTPTPQYTAQTGGSDAVGQSNGGQFRYVGATKSGTLIPIAKRKLAGPASAELLNGTGTFSLAADRGKVVVLNFWATWCPPCRIETPQFDALYRQLKSPTLQFVGLAVKDVNKSSVQSFVHDNDITYPIAYDQTGKSALQLGKLPLVGLPDTVVIDKQGRVAAVYIGALTPGDLTPVLTHLTTET